MEVLSGQGERAGDHGILVVADESCIHTRLCHLVAEHLGEEGRVLVLAPALNKRLRHYVSDSGDAEHRAQRVLDHTLMCMRARGLTASGRVADADPLTAIDDWFDKFGPDEIVIATHPEDQVNWLERGVVEKARVRYPVTVTHMVVERPPSADESSFVP